MRICVLGAGGLVGKTLLKVIEERNFPYDEIILFGTRNEEIEINEKKYFIEKFEGKIPDCDIFFSCLDTKEAKEIIPEIIKKGERVIDNSSAFRLEKDVPLVIPEINGNELNEKNLLIANPNCSTIQLILSISPFLNYGIKRVFVSTYQSISGAGKKGISAYEHEKRGESYSDSPFPYRIYENLIPWIGEIKEGETVEERKMILEGRKILKNEELEIYPICVRVPVPYVHSQSVFLCLEKEITEEEAIEEIKKRDYLLYEEIPTPLNYRNKDIIGIGRIKVKNNILKFFTCMDNLRKGAATNAVQIGEYYVR